MGRGWSKRGEEQIMTGADKDMINGGEEGEGEGRKGGNEERGRIVRGEEETGRGGEGRGGEGRRGGGAREGEREGGERNGRTRRRRRQQRARDKRCATRDRCLCRRVGGGSDVSAKHSGRCSRGPTAGCQAYCCCL